MIVERSNRFIEDYISHPQELRKIISEIYDNIKKGKYLREHYSDDDLITYDPHELVQFRNTRRGYIVYSMDIDPSIHRFTYRIYLSGPKKGKIVCTNCKFHMHGTDSYSITNEVNEIISRKQFSNLL